MAFSMLQDYTTYTDREYRDDSVIQTWKQNINYFFADSILNVLYFNINDNILILDGPEERTRKTLTGQGIPNENIVTVNRECNFRPPLYYNCEMDNFHNYNNTKFKYAWLDCINRGKKMADIFKNFIRYNASFPCIVGVTINTRGRTSGRSYDTPKGWESWIKKWCNSDDLLLEPIDFDYDDYDFRIRKICGKSKIPKNWAYNGCHGITEGTMSAFFIISKF